MMECARAVARSVVVEVDGASRCWMLATPKMGPSCTTNCTICVLEANLNTVPDDETAGQGDVCRATPPKAVLWDMDGTLVDTEPYWIATEMAIAAEHGATWTQEDALELVGSDLLESGRRIQQKMGLDLEPRLLQ